MGLSGSGGASEGATGVAGGIEFLVSVEAPEVRVAEVRGGRLWGLEVDRGGRLLGDIFKGRVANVVAGMDAAFVDIGLGHNALIYEGDVVRERARATRGTGSVAGARLRAGEEVVVQVARPPVGSKGARVTMRLSLPGRFVVLSEHADTLGVSRRIESEDERARLRRLSEKLRPLDHGLVVRTEAEGASEAQLASDVRMLVALLEEVRSRGRAAPAPSRLHRDLGILGRLVRDRLGEDVSRVTVDDAETFEALRLAVRGGAPGLEERLEMHLPGAGGASLFKARGVERDAERATARTVPLPSGGNLVIDEAEALTAIDVNTARATGRGRSSSLAETVLATNLEAVEESARQMRLRDVGGVIAIDFIDMERTRDRVRVLDALEAALSADRARTRIVQLSPSGLVEITRRREGLSLKAALHRSCPYCAGRGVVKSPQTVAIEARRRIREAAARAALSFGAGVAGAARMQLVMHPESACALLEGEGALLSELEREVRAEVHVAVDFSLHLESSRLSQEAEAGPGDALFAPLGGLGSRLVPGERLSLAASTPLYPAQEPAYAVLHGSLVRLEGLEGEALPIDTARAATTRALLIEVTHAGRWFARAQIVP